MKLTLITTALAMTLGIGAGAVLQQVTQHTVVVQATTADTLCDELKMEQALRLQALQRQTLSTIEAGKSPLDSPADTAPQRY
jgi:hypothetical protein